MIGVAQYPVSFFCRDDKTMGGRLCFKKVGCELDPKYSNGAVTNNGVSRTINSENCRKVTGGRVKNCFRKKKRTGRLRARFHNVVIKPFCVNHSAVGNRKYQSEFFLVEVWIPGSRLRNCIEPRHRGET